MAETKVACSSCGKNKKLGDYYSSASPIYKYHGRITVCKDCLWDLVDDHDIRSVISVLRMIDKPFLVDLWESSIREAEKQNRSSVFGTYMKNVVMRQHREKNYDDSAFENVEVEAKVSERLGIDRDVLNRWRGWDEDKIIILEEHYQDLINTYEHDTPIQRSIYRNIAVAQMQADYAISNGKSNDYKKYMDVISGLMNDAKIKPLQETSADDGTLSTWGQWVAKIEEEEPIPEPTEEFKDVDGIRKYINKWFLHHLKRMLGIENSSLDPSEDEK